MTQRPLGRCLALVTLLFASSLAQAQTTYTWTGGGADANWLTAGNWSASAGSPPPANDITNTILVMTGNTQLANFQNYSFSANSLTFDAGAGPFVVGGNETLTLGAGGITVLGANNQTFNSGLGVGQAGTWANNGTGLFTVGGAVNLSGNSLTVGGSGNSVYTGVISNTGTITKTGAGTVTFSGANTYSGGTTISQGTVVVGNTGALGSGNVLIAPASAEDASLLVNVGGGFARTIQVGVLNDTGTGDVVIGTQTGLSGSVTFTAPTLFVRRPFTIQAGQSAGNTSFSFVEFRQEGTTIAHMTISAPTPATTTTNKVVFTNPATASTFGDLTIGDAAGPHAVVQFGVGSDSGNIVPDSSVINFFQAPDGGGGGSQLIFAPDVIATGETIGALHSLSTGAGTVTTLTGGIGDPLYTLTVGGGDRSGNFSGVITQGGAAGDADIAITKIGAGTQVFSGNNTYTGATTVNGGTLLVNGQSGGNSGTGTGAVTVNNTGTFGGTGRAQGAVTVNSGGTISGGDAGIGTLTLGADLTFNTGARQGFRITDAGAPAAESTGGSSIGTIPNPTNNNFIDIGGSFFPLGDTTSYQFVIDGTGATFNPAQSYSYQVGRIGTNLVGPFALTNQAQFTTVGFSEPFIFSITAAGGANAPVFLNISPVPEPATVLALAAGALGAGGSLRRRLRRVQPGVQGA